MRKVLYMFGLLSDVDVQWIAKTGVLKDSAPAMS